jgi:HK97 family phage prohead protease
VGRLVEWSEDEAGLSTSWRLANTPAADAVLAEAADGVRDGLSVGVEVIRSAPRGGVLEVLEGKLVEVSLVAFPAYEAARVERVAASDSPTIPGRDPRTLRLRLTLGD